MRTNIREPRSILHIYLDDMLLEVRASNYYSGLALALSILDICAKIEYPAIEKIGDRYRKWVEEWCKMISISADDCYALRCAYLHSGTDALEGRSAENAIFDAIGFTVGKSGGGWLTRAFPSADGKSKPTAAILVESLCQEIATSADDWCRARGTDQRVADRIAALMQMRPAS